MKQIYQQATEVVVWLYESPFTASDESAAWNIVKHEKGRRLT